MPPRSKIDLLPEAIRKELEKRLVGSAFGDCRGLAAWLLEQGFEISKTTVNAWGQSYKERLQALQIATHQAKALVEAAPDEEGAVNDALIRIAQERIFKLLLEMEIDPEKVDVNKLFRAVADVTRASTTNKRWMATVKAKGAAVIDEMAKSSGMSEEQAAAWRAKFLGIAPS